MSLWRKRNVKHNEQKHDNLSNPLDRLHQENVRLGLYEIVYDLSIKSDDLSIKSEEAMREVQRLGQEIEQEPVGWIDSKGNMICTKINESCKPLYITPQQRLWVGLTAEEIDEIIENSIDKVDALIQTMDKLKEKNL